MPSVKANRVATQLLVSASTRDRARALAVVQSTPVAEVWREMVEDKKLLPYERKHRDALDLLERCFEVQGVDPAVALELMIKKNLNLSDLLDEDGRPLPEFPW